MELPLIAGVGGGCGSTTLAYALGGPGVGSSSASPVWVGTTDRRSLAIDCGVYQGGAPVDVLVARSTMQSLGCAQRAIAAAPEPPILAVVADTPNSSLTRPMKARLRMTDPQPVVVMVPFVADWREMDNPYEVAAGVLVTGSLPKSLRDFAEALHHLVEEINPRVLRRATLAQSTYGPVNAYPPAFPPDSISAAWPGVQ